VFPSSGEGGRRETRTLFRHLERTSVQYVSPPSLRAETDPVSETLFF
jgi:hypothetical protein